MPLDWKSLRMRRSADFERVRACGQSYVCREFVMGVLRVDVNEGNRFGFVSSRKVGGAVERNRARRRLRSLVRDNIDRLLSGVWLVLVARKPTTRARWEELEKSWDRLAEQAGILQNPRPRCRPD